MSSGLRPPHWQTRAGECSDLARAFYLRVEREPEAWAVLRESDGTSLYTATDLADLETWLNGFAWGFRFEPRGLA